MSSSEELRAVRLAKKAALEKSGVNCFPAHTKRDTVIADAVASFDALVAEKKVITLAGRLMSLRGQGGLSFGDLFDGTAKMQVLLKKDILGITFDLWNDTVDIADFIEATGTLFTTKRGEKTLEVSSWTMLTKSLAPLPEKWHGITDPEERFRKRYLDILMNPEVADIVYKRSLFWNTIRQFLLKQNFVEVETPVLENTTGGADARPFVTHHNALDIDVFLRISAGELWQKKLLVAGIPRTFEIGRIFRNEGISNEHLQDYTQLEFYMAYSDYVEGMKMVQKLYKEIALAVCGKTKLSIKGMDVDLEAEWQTYDFLKVIKDEYGIDALHTTLAEVEAALRKHDIVYEKEGFNIERGVDLLWKRIRKGIAGPGFLVNVPVYLEPLAKRNRNNPETVERFQIILAGSEMGKGFSELNDPIDQRERFMKQQALRDAGDDEAQMADMDFVEALEHGMPPAFGFGLSERLFSFLLDKPVREAQIFPLLRPRGN